MSNAWANLTFCATMSSMKDSLVARLIADLSAGLTIHTPAELQAGYPARELPDGAEVMRVPPSPTGFVHIGTIYAGLVNERIAHQTGGRFILRIEDTDKKREVEGSLDGIVQAFHDFAIGYDEGPDGSGDKDKGAYGPYLQSRRTEIYLAFAFELLQNGRAYPCFATAEELEANAKAQQAAKLRPGYYGTYALWRDKSDDEIEAALDAGRAYVLRFRSKGRHEDKVAFDDVFKGHVEMAANDLDVPLIKSDGTRLPTYHLAHVVDDTLMRVTKVFRSDEWLPSTPLHLELCDALRLPHFTYGHFAPISIIDAKNGGKRKLSKRKDDQANVAWWIQRGYPVEGVKAYLLGLANSNFEEWYRAQPAGTSVEDYHVDIAKLAASRAPLLDMTKLEDYCKDYIASLPLDQFVDAVVDRSKQNAPDFFAVLSQDAAYTRSVLNIERDGPKPRKDLAAWGDAGQYFGYFFDSDDQPFVDLAAACDELLTDFSQDLIHTAQTTFLKYYDPKADKDAWFEHLKTAAQETGFATDPKAYKADPGSYKGNTADFAKIIRVSLTGQTRTPDLCEIMRIMGPERVRRRLQLATK